MFGAIIDFFTAVPFWELLLILIAKVFEVTLGTMRLILIAKGYRKEGTILAMVEIMLWVFIAGTVITDMSEAPVKGLIYGIGFAMGVYIGSLIENKVAVGKMSIQAIATPKSAQVIMDLLRSHGHGVTSVEARGKDSDRMVLYAYVNRKNKDQVIKLIQDAEPKALVVANEVSLVHGGYISPWRKIAK